jgi:hypothetical protein
MALDLKSRPNRVPWPPLLGAAALALAGLAERAYPLGLGLGPALRGLGLPSAARRCRGEGTG